MQKPGGRRNPVYCGDQQTQGMGARKALCTHNMEEKWEDAVSWKLFLKNYFINTSSK